MVEGEKVIQVSYIVAFLSSLCFVYNLRILLPTTLDTLKFLFFRTNYSCLLDKVYESAVYG